MATQTSLPHQTKPFDPEDEFDIPLHMVASDTSPYEQDNFGFDSPPPPLNFATIKKEDVAMDLTSPSQELQLSGEAALPEAKIFESNGAFPPKTDQSRS